MNDGTVDGIRLERGTNLDWIVFDRPNAANAFNAAMLARFSEVLEECAIGGAPVVAIRGGGKGFSAGVDLGEYNAQGSPSDDVMRLSSYVDRWKAMLGHSKPVIAAVHGYCVGVAAQLASFADILIVAEDCRISEPSIPIGGGFIAPSWVIHVGARRAKEFAFLPGNWIDGVTAVEWGWANSAVPAESLVECVEALAARIALIPPGVLAMKKRAINRAVQAAGFDVAMSAVAESDAILHADPDVRAIRDDLRTNGLKQTKARFEGESSQEILRRFGADVRSGRLSR